MVFKQKFQNIFNAVNFEIIENLKECIISFDAPNLESLSEQNIECIAKFIEDRDDYKILIEYTEDINLEINKDNFNDISSFINRVKLTFNEKEDVLKYQITINKNIIDNHLTIYSYCEFSETLFKGNLFDFINKCNYLRDKCDCHFIFDCINDDIILKTNYFYFTNEKKEITETKIDIDNIIIDKYSDVCNDTSNFDMVFTPDNFDILSRKNINQKSIAFFDQIKYLLSIMYISDSCKLSNETLHFELKGYRTIKKEIELKEFSKNNDTFFKIYQWMYQGGNTSDKAQITKNILTLHCKYSDILEIDGSILDTIKSNYNLYLKDNVKDYLQLKQNITESILRYCNNMGESLSKLLGYFKGNFIAIFGFIATLYFSEALKEQGFVNLFVGQTAVITSFLLLGSLIWWGFSILEIIQKKFFYKKELKALKLSYEDVVEKEELKKIIDENEILKLAEKQCVVGAVIIGLVWLLFLIFLFIALDALSRDIKLLLFYNCIN